MNSIALILTAHTKRIYSGWWENIGNGAKKEATDKSYWFSVLILLSIMLKMCSIPLFSIYNNSKLNDKEREVWGLFYCVCVCLCFYLSTHFVYSIIHTHNRIDNGMWIVYVEFSVNYFNVLLSLVRVWYKIGHFCMFNWSMFAFASTH